MFCAEVFLLILPEIKPLKINKFDIDEKSLKILLSFNKNKKELYFLFSYLFKFFFL